MLYVDREGRAFPADSRAELVRKMHEASRSPCADDATFMKEVAARIWTVQRVTIRTTDPETFVQDLIAEGFFTTPNRS